MTTFEQWSLIIQFLSVVGLLGTLSFIGYQTVITRKQLDLTRQQVERNARQSVLGYMAAIDKIIIENAWTYPYFYRGKKISETDKDYHKVLAVAMAVTNFLESTLPQDGDQTMSHWNTYIEEQFSRSPILCDYLREHSAWFDKRLVYVMEKSQAQLNQAQSLQ